MFGKFESIDIQRKPLVDVNTKAVTFGSCFAFNIYQTLRQYNDNLVSMEFGVQYNVHSVQNILNNYVKGKYLEEHDLIPLNSNELTTVRYSNLYFPAAYSDKFLERARTRESKYWENIKQAEICIITLGTSDVLRLKSTNEIVTNTNHLDKSLLLEDRLSMSDNLKCLEQIREIMKSESQVKHFIVTVSPQIYKFGKSNEDYRVVNSSSKANMRAAADVFYKLHDDVHYFPSYEIVIDELRGWEYFSLDRVHVSNETRNYIMKRFFATYCTEALEELTILLNKAAQLFYRFEHFYSIGFREMAKEYYQKCVDLLDSLSDVQMNETKKKTLIVQMLLRQNRYAEISNLLESMGDNRRNFVLEFLYALSLKETGKTEYSIGRFKALLEKYSLTDENQALYVKIYHHLGEMYYQQKELHLAKEYFTRHCLSSVNQLKPSLLNDIQINLPE
ncbi:hypothetical protein GF337_01230 [candidate division KSB1 bacterium]|nr:hypothetical protein [candidate division KSB1 bacterium]